MKKSILSLLIVFPIFLIHLSCAEDSIEYRNDIYKAIINNSNIEDMGLIKGAYTAIDTFITKNIDAINIDSYNLFETLYGINKDSIAVDSVFFINNILISFEISTSGGDLIDSYTYNVVADTLILNCKVNLWQGSAPPLLLSPYIITFRNAK
jgi:hypothetical protein